MKLPDTLAEACSPSTPATRLIELAATLPPPPRRLTASADATALAMALARNPNTPPHILESLLAPYPGDVLRNPVLPFLLLEDPAWLQRMHPNILHSAVRALVDPPLPFLVAATRHPDLWVRLEAENHIALAGEVKPEEWQQAVRAFWYDYATKAKSEEQQAISEMVELTLLPSQHFHVTPLPDAESDIQQAREAARNSENEKLSSAATVLLSPATTPGVLLALVDISSISAPWYWRALARHPKADTRLLTALVTTHKWKQDASLRRVALHQPQADADVREAAIAAACQEVSIQMPLCQFASVHAFRQGGYPALLARPVATLPITRVSYAVLTKFLSEVEKLPDDNNRLVRAAARARLRGETFSWE